MAYENHNWAWRVLGVRGSHYVALHALANEAGGTGQVQRLKLATLARRCNVTYETARKLTADLAEWDLISVECRQASTGRQVSNCYRLNRRRLFPKNSESEEIGRHLWGAVLGELGRIRGEVETYLLKNQIREAFFDGSIRETKTAQRRGVLYVIAETDAVIESFRQNLKYLYKLRDQFRPYLVDYFELIQRPQFEEEEESAYVQAGTGSQGSAATESVIQGL